MAYLKTTTIGGKLNVIGTLETDALTMGSTTVTDITNSITNDATKLATAKGVYDYIQNNTASLATSATSGITYTENTSLAVPSGGYLYINAGFIGNTKISLSTLIPDITSDATAAYILSGYKAYTDTGAVLTGTMANKGAVTGSITTQNGTYTIPAGYHNGSGKVTATLASATPAFDGGAASIKTSSTSATASGLTITDTDTDPGSGVYISTSGSATPTRAAVLYNGAVAGYVSVADNASALAAADGSATTLTGNKYYVTKVTVPASKRFTEFNLTAGSSSSRTYLTTLNVPGYTTIDSIVLSGIIEAITCSSGILRNVTLTGSNGITTLSNGATVTTYSGTGGITTYTNTGTIGTMTGSRTISKLASSSAAGALTITTNGYSSSYKGTVTVTTNTNGTVNVWNTGGDKGVQVSGHTVKVDGVTVTNSSGDLTAATVSATSIAPGGSATVSVGWNSSAKTITATDYADGDSVYY